jgi:hypothetical protein
MMHMMFIGRGMGMKVLKIASPNQTAVQGRNHSENRRRLACGTVVLYDTWSPNVDHFLAIILV